MLDVLCRTHHRPESQPLLDTLVTREGNEGAELATDFGHAGWGTGQQCTLTAPDVVITVIDALITRPLTGRCEMLEDVLLVRANVESACSYAGVEQGPWRFVRPELTVSFLPRGTCVDVTLEPGKSHTAITVLMRPSALIDRCGLRRQDLPEPLLQALDGELKQPARLLAMPLETGFSSLVEDLVRSKLPDHMRALQIRARCVELLVLIAAAWKERLANGTESPMRGRDAYIVAAARRILTQRLVDPPTLQELAQELGTNRNKLNQLFQQGLGVTPKAYGVQRRIERAQALLREGHLNVAQIAETVGYQHQSSFAAAFRDAVGVCPRDYGNHRQVPSARAFAAA